MKLIDGKEYIESILNREFQGARITPEEYNMYLSAIFPNFVKNRLEIYTTQMTQNIKDIFVSMKIFEPLLKIEEIQFNNGSFNITDLSFEFLFYSGGYCIYNNKQLNVKLVSVEEFKDRLINLRNPVVHINPIITMMDGKFYIVPKNIQRMTIYYYTVPVIPFLDYYIRSGKIYFLDEDSVVNLSSGDILSDGSVVNSSQVYNSKTRELRLNENLHLEFFNELLRNISLKFKENDVYGHSMNVKQEENML